jgi:hypothetical protein
MSAETLRRAAALMRERAEAATDGSWETYSDESERHFDQYGVGVTSTVTFDVVAYSGQIYSRDAEHIASWHPAVALAVADLLDEAVDHLLAHDDIDTFGAEAVCPTAREGLECSVLGQALNVARAYLGEQS